MGVFSVTLMGCFVCSGVPGLLELLLPRLAMHEMYGWVSLRVLGLGRLLAALRNPPGHMRSTWKQRGAREGAREDVNARVLEGELYYSGVGHRKAPGPDPHHSRSRRYPARQILSVQKM